jgi:Alw26I/Eco31I/Esp3I family type II restriction endonuclease
MKCSICNREGHINHSCTMNTPASESGKVNSQWKAYKEHIESHPNYKFIPEEVKRNWTCVSKGGTNPRKAYWDEKQKELIESGAIPPQSSLVNVARHVHPTKKHTCEKCGAEHSIYFIYPTKNTWKWLAQIGVERSEQNIFDIYAASDKKQEFERYFGLPIHELETQCNNDRYTGSKLSPGVLGNPPDRLDGFHSYNSICGCRYMHDKGRGEANMKSYTRDRRAYELLSDGNCLQANALMGGLNTVTAQCFKCGKVEKMTADHIGPISLWFVHDTVNFQACCNACNSNKNNRMTNEDVGKIKAMEGAGKTLVSWWAADAWEKNKDKNIASLRSALDDNTKKFLCIMVWLKMNNRSVLETFVDEFYMNHDKSYTIRNIEISGGVITFEHTEKISSKKKKSTQVKRTKQILLEINEKANRKNKVCLSTAEQAYLSDIRADTFKNKICKVLAGL